MLGSIINYDIPKKTLLQGGGLTKDAANEPMGI
jgi:hypothetical protein